MTALLMYARTCRQKKRPWSNLRGYIVSFERPQRAIVLVLNRYIRSRQSFIRLLACTYPLGGSIIMRSNRPHQRMLKGP